MPSEDRFPRLILSLAFISGRQPDPKRPVRFCAQAAEVRPTPEAPVWISLGDWTLHVYAAEPKLVVDGYLPKLCWERCQRLRIKLPRSWRHLADGPRPKNEAEYASAIHHAKKILPGISGVPKITLRDVSHSLTFALLEASRGDLGLVKLITDVSSANMDNIIHYASYEICYAQRLWCEAIRSLLPSYDEPALGQEDHRRAGSAQPLDVTKVREQIVSARQRVADRLAQRDSLGAFNMMTWYLARWMALQCAGRKTRYPVPAVIMDDGCAWTKDKHRPDESTDRISFVTENARQQLSVYVALAESLSPFIPGLLEAIRGNDRCAVNLVYVNGDGTISPYLPRVANYLKAECRLTENFARKLIRSEARALPGRFLDAWLGHWVAGRHPYSLISTMAMPELRRQCLSILDDLERQLGFELVIPEGMGKLTPQWACPPPKVNRAKAGVAPEPEPLAQFEQEQVHALLMEVAPNIATIILAGGSLIPTDAKKLMDRVVEHLFALNDPQAAEKVFRVCDEVRELTGIPIFGAKPKARLARAWIANHGGMASLAYLQRHVLRPFRQDLAALPEVIHEGLNMDVELGRLIMVLAWRCGIAHSSHLDRLIAELGSDRPVLALHTLRYTQIAVRCERTRETMLRTVFFEGYAAAYVSVERSRIRHIYAKRLASCSLRRRRAVYEQALTAYLKHLDVKEFITVAELMLGIRHWILLNGTPVLAAAASGEIFTDDLGDVDLRRLSGIEPFRKGVKAEEPEISPDEDVDPMPRPSDRTSESMQVSTLVATHRCSSRVEWAQAIRSTEVKPGLASMLKQYALWMLRDAAGGSAEVALEPRRQTEICRNVEMISLAFGGFSKASDGGVRLDDMAVNTLYEHSREHHGARMATAAWTSFVAYLRDPQANKASIEVEPLHPEFGGKVSAKMMSTDEANQVYLMLESVLSGISAPAVRETARQHFELTAACGARRSEMERLRVVDALDNLVRIQAFGKYTLKTASAHRNIPLEAISKAVSQMIECAKDAGHIRVIDVTGDPGVAGDRWYDDVNKLIQLITGDPSLTQHHLRHTFACRALLTLISWAIDLQHVYGDFPWLEKFLLPKAEMDVLLGQEGPASHGLQAVVDMLGHLHGTTTLHHYIHVCCIGLYALMSTEPVPELGRAFRDRVASAPTVNRARRKASSVQRRRA